MSSFVQRGGMTAVLGLKGPSVNQLLLGSV